eukprot:TRINITY_DN63075_c0_g1_i1.p1 TRINITY_DN63075_c0_g1~~TRINITY_DN63075_c0_g1_i1.p1  ORF type:complete len:314 (-),score=45.86 TRINITY_DN63075_c0_g1_i1:186-1046(-)
MVSACVEGDFLRSDCCLGQHAMRRRRLRRAAGASAAYVAVTTGLFVASFSAKLFVPAIRPTSRSVVTRLSKGRATQASVSTCGDVEFAHDYVTLGSHVLVRPSEAAATSEAGFVLPESAREMVFSGEVVGVGTGAWHPDTGVELPLWSQVGRSVLYDKYAAEALLIGDVNHVVIRDDDVLLSYSGDEAIVDTIRIPRGKVLVQIGESRTVSLGGLVLPKGGKSEKTFGIVAVVGDPYIDGRGNHHPLELSVGDRIQFRSGSGVTLKLDKIEYRIVEVADCLAKWSS